MRAGGLSCLLMLSQGRCCLSETGRGSNERASHRLFKALARELHSLVHDLKPA